MRFVIVADDLTGACDAGVQLAGAGHRTLVVLDGSAPAERADAVVFDTDSRALPDGEAAERVRRAAHAMRGATVAFKKIDSTLRGPVAAELVASLRASGRRCGVLAPASPRHGRTTTGSVQRVDGVPVHRTVFAEGEGPRLARSHLPSLLAGASPGEATALTVDEVRRPGLVRWAIESSRWVVADAATDEDLAALVRSVPDPSSVMWAGSAGLAQALADAHPGGHAACGWSPEPGGVLAVVGSLNPATRRQLDTLLAAPDIQGVALEVDPATELPSGGSHDATLRPALEALSRGRAAVLYPTDRFAGTPSRQVQGAVAAGLADLAGCLVERAAVGSLVLTGGDVAVHTARRLGASAIWLEGELEAGVPRGRLVGPHALPVATKAGGFGTPATLLNVVGALRAPGGTA